MSFLPSLLTAEQAAALIGVRSCNVRRYLAARLGEIVVGYTRSGRPRKRYRADLVLAYAEQRRERLARADVERDNRGSCNVGRSAGCAMNQAASPMSVRTGAGNMTAINSAGMLTADVCATTASATLVIIAPTNATP